MLLAPSGCVVWSQSCWSILDVRRLDIWLHVGVSRSRAVYKYAVVSYMWSYSTVQYSYKIMCTGSKYPARSREGQKKNYGWFSRQVWRRITKKLVVKPLEVAHYACKSCRRVVREGSFFPKLLESTELKLFRNFHHHPSVSYKRDTHNEHRGRVQSMAVVD